MSEQLVGNFQCTCTVPAFGAQIAGRPLRCEVCRGLVAKPAEPPAGGTSEQEILFQQGVLFGLAKGMKIAEAAEQRATRDLRQLLVDAMHIIGAEVSEQGKRGWANTLGKIRSVLEYPAKDELQPDRLAAPPTRLTATRLLYELEKEGLIKVLGPTVDKVSANIETLRKTLDDWAAALIAEAEKGEGT